MAVIAPTTTLADVVTAHPSLARELERRGLDYCCGGDRSLGDACTARGLDPQTVAAELGSAIGSDEPAAWATMDPAQLVDHLETTHHRYLWDELPRLDALLEKVLTVHGARHPELADVLAGFAEVRADLEPHLVKEEEVLFPMVRALATATGPRAFHCGTVRNPIAVMLREHDAVGELLARLHVLTGGYAVPDDGCASYRAAFEGLARLEADTHLHIHKENNLLFPAVARREDELARVPTS